MYSSIDNSRWHFELKKDLPWGFAIYRCSYQNNDEAWERIISKIYDEVKSGLECEGRLDLLPSQDLVTFDDKAKFNGATSHEVRDHFSAWVGDQLPQIAAGPDKLQRLMAKESPADTLGPHYNFCLFVDDICMESLDHMQFPVVKLLSRQ